MVSSLSMGMRYAAPWNVSRSKRAKQTEKVVWPTEDFPANQHALRYDAITLTACKTE
jgi:hypothetical protein